MIVLLPNVEAIVSTFLRAQPEVIAIASTRVYTELPKTKTFPLVRVTRLGGTAVVGYPLRLDSARIQVEAYGGPKATAWLLAETCRQVIADRLADSYDLDDGAPGVVTGVTFQGLLYQPDVGFDPAQPRYIADVTVFARPA